MAIQIGSTEVITNAFKLQSITGGTGFYDNFQPNVVSLTPASSVTLSMSNAYSSIALTGNTTFSLSNVVEGKTAIITMDLDGNTPTFGGVAWAEDTTPAWSTYRYWTVALVCWSGSVVRGIASGHESTGGTAPPQPDVDLPNGPWQMESFGNNLGGFANGTFIMSNSGQASFTGSGTGGVVTFGNLSSPATWLYNGVASDYDVRWDYTNNLSNGEFITGRNPGTGWLNLGTTRQWGIEDTSVDGGDESISGTLYVRRASNQEQLAEVFVSITVNFSP
jgi:hypothetical protein